MLQFIVLFISLIFQFGELTTDDFSSKINKLVEKQLDKNFKIETRLIEFEPELQNTQASNSMFYYIHNTDNQSIGIAVITNANGCIIGGCGINKSLESRFEKFHFLSIYNIEKELQALVILDYPGEHGFEISAKWWLKQFIGRTQNKHIYGNNIDAISGATISGQSVVNEVNKINKIIAQIDL